MPAARILTLQAFWACVIHVLVVAASALNAQPEDNSLKAAMPWYHTTDELHHAFETLASNCKEAELSFVPQDAYQEQGEELSLDVLRVRRAGSSPKVKAMFVFGEHAREIITVESAKHLVESLCNDASTGNQILNNVEFVIIPNANPLGRKLVESGKYCARTNLDGVDINRNWNESIANDEEQGSNTNPGPHSFSEPETQIIRTILQTEQPDLFMSVHSGAYMLGLPFGYSKDRAPRDEQQMMNLLKQISDNYCDSECPYGRLADVIDYDVKGCDMDYVYENLPPAFAFTWEIYTDESFKGRYVAKAKALRGSGDIIGAPLSMLTQPSRSFLQSADRFEFANDRNAACRQALRRAAELQQDADTLPQTIGSSEQHCMLQFNPTTEEATLEVLRRWTPAYLELCAAFASLDNRRS